jgi:signal transduction histidine kinase
MLRSLSRLNHPFHLMLYLEWILLGITLLGLIRPGPHRFDASTLPFAVLTLIVFGLMGLRLPTGNMPRKLIYTGAEFALLCITFWLDDRTLFFPLVGVIMVIRSCLIFDQLGRLMVAGLVLISSLVAMFQQAPPPRPPHRPPFDGIPADFANTILTLKLNTAVTFGLTLLFTLLLVNALLSERQSREKLLQANRQLRQYALRIEDQATLQERNRIAREIHDALGHALTAQSIQLENAELFLPPEAEKTRSFLQEAQQLGARALQEVRRSISTLRSNPLRGQSLSDAIAQAVQEFHQATDIQPDLTIQIPSSLSTEISMALYRILQEALTNIYKHSGATQVRIYLQQYSDTVQLEIEDNGQGFDPDTNTTGFGLQGMRERTATLNGRMQISSQFGSGCRIHILVPLPALAL